MLDFKLLTEPETTSKDWVKSIQVIGGREDKSFRNRASLGRLRLSKTLKCSGHLSKMTERSLTIIDLVLFFPREKVMQTDLCMAFPVLQVISVFITLDFLGFCLRPFVSQKTKFFGLSNEGLFIYSVGG